MKKIMLCCSSGMSTSLLVKKMKEEADKRGLDAEIQAFGAAEFDLQMPHYQVVLLGPRSNTCRPNCSSERRLMACLSTPST
ncbi:PTS sugar transporter subunit IIB [Aeromonas rivipollensis]